MHKHKICGSNGKLYSSRCHLRRAACESTTYIRPAHPDQCLQDEENDDDEIAPSEQVDADTLDNHANQVDHDLPPNGIADSSSHPLDYSEEDECRPNDYDLMKQKVLNKSKSDLKVIRIKLTFLNF